MYKDIKHSEVRVGDIVGWTCDLNPPDATFEVLSLTGSPDKKNLRRVSGLKYSSKFGWTDFSKEPVYPFQRCVLIKRELNIKTFIPVKRSICLS